MTRVTPWGPFSDYFESDASLGLHQTMSIRIVVHADLDRAGLGNLLLPWARAEIFRQKYGLEMLAPRWTQPKIGPLLRGERDLRYYWRIFSDVGYITGLRRAWLLQSGVKLDEAAAGEFVDSSFVARGHGTVVVRFAGHLEGHWFDGLWSDRSLIRRRLLQILSSRSRQCLSEVKSFPTIAVHVRRGDKVVAKVGEACTISNRSPSDEWFVAVIRSLRQFSNPETPVTVYSDGKPEQLRSILALPNVALSPPAPAVVDMLCMARARVLVTSGISSFSMWPAFIGEVPAISYPGTGARLNPHIPGWDTETTLGGELDPLVRPHLVARLSERQSSATWESWALGL
jgi:hypothetical protein